MDTNRRDFLGVAAQLPLAAVALPMLAEEAEAQVGEVLLRFLAPAFTSALWNFGRSVLVQGLAGALGTWLYNAVATPATPSAQRPFPRRFDPPVTIDTGREGPFAGQTVIQPTRALMVNRLPCLVPDTRSTPVEAAYLNGREMDELCNRDNPWLYTANQYRIPATYNEREPCPDYVAERFRKWATKGGYTDATPEYMRLFCTCREQNLIGVGYRRGYNQDIEQFSVLRWNT